MHKYTKKNSALIWLYLQDYTRMHGQQNIKFYETGPESKYTMVCTTFLIYKSDTVNEMTVHNFTFQHSRRHCPNIYEVLEPASVSPSHRSLPSAL